jgi:hypothetical protein
MSAKRPSSAGTPPDVRHLIDHRHRAFTLRYNVSTAIDHKLILLTIA